MKIYAKNELPHEDRGLLGSREYAFFNNCELIITTLPPNGYATFHRHLTGGEFIKVLFGGIKVMWGISDGCGESGLGLYTTKRFNSRMLTSGDSVYFAAGELHAIVNPSPLNTILICLKHQCSDSVFVPLPDGIFKDDKEVIDVVNNKGGYVKLPNQRKDNLVNTDFQAALARVLKNEGGYVNDPTDRGGETYCGISHKNFPLWEGWKIIDEINAARASTDPPPRADNPVLAPMVQNFYKRMFWDVIRGDDLPQPLDAEVFDTAVNVGAGTATKLLQHALNLLNRSGTSWPDILEDGDMGPTTKAVLSTAVLKGDLTVVYNLFNVLQAMKYVLICERDPSQEKFLRGWLTRVDIVPVQRG